MGKPLNITDDNFEAEVVKSDKPVLVDFWAPWCGPCKLLGPILEQVGAEKGDALKIVKVNVDECPKVAGRLGVRGLPTMVLFRDGKVAGTLTGLRAKSDLLKWIDSDLANPASEAKDIAQLAAENKKGNESEEEMRFADETGRLLRRYVMAPIMIGSNALLAAGGIGLALTGGVPLMVLGGGIAAYNAFQIAKVVKNGVQKPVEKFDEKITAGTLVRTAVSVGSLAGGVVLFASGAPLLLALPAAALCIRGGLGTLTNGSLLYGAGKKALTGPAAPKTITSEVTAAPQPKAAAPAPEEKPGAAAAPEFKNAAEAIPDAPIQPAPKPESRPPAPPRP